MLFSLAVLLFISPTVTAVTDLQTLCTGADRVYSGTSCYAYVKTVSKTHDQAKTSCNHYLGYSGHLAHIKNAADQAALKQAMNSALGNLAWTGIELLNSSAATNDSTNWSNYYRNGTFVSAPYLPWRAGYPVTSTANNRINYYGSVDGISMAPKTNAYYYICQYEEALKQPVSDLEKKCFNLTSSSVLTLFVNDVCYVLQATVTKNYANAKMSCNALSGYTGHLAHVCSMNELWIAEALRAAANVTYVRLGIERTNASSTDGCNGWYLTKPTNQSVPTAFLPWSTTPAASSRTIGVTAGYPKSFAAIANVATYPFICQYGNTAATTCTATTTSTMCTTTSTTTTTTTTTTTSTTTSTTTPTTTSTMTTTTTPTTTSTTTPTTTSTTTPTTTSTMTSTTTPTTTPTTASTMTTTTEIPTTIPITTLITTPTAAGTACNITTPTIQGGTGSKASRFYHYSFGYFTNTCHWLSQSTTTVYGCISMCYTNELCFGVTYNSGTSDCQLLAIIANELPYSSELTADSQYDTYVRQRY